MTRERAAEICQYIKFILKNEDYTEEVEEALNMAIEALEEIYPCGLCKIYEDGDWGVCQYCPAKPKGSDEE